MQIQLPNQYSGFDSAGKGPITYLSIYANIEDSNGDLVERIGLELEPDPNSMIKLIMGAPDW